MTSRERVLASLNHEQPDKVPIDLGSTYNSGISACALYRLRDYYGLPQHPIQIYETSQMIGAMDSDIIEIMDIDVIGLNCAKDCVGVPLYGNMQDFVMPDKTPVNISAMHSYKIDQQNKTFLYPQGNEQYEPSYLMPEGGYFFDTLNRSPGYDEDALTPAEDFKDDFKLISDQDADWYASNARLLRETTDKAIFGCFGMGGIGDPSAIPGGHVLQPRGIRSYQDWSMAQLLYPEYIHTVFDMQTQNALKCLEIYHQAVGDNIDVINISGTDFGTQAGPIMALSTFRTLYKPYYKRMNDWVHEHTNWKTHYHCCGAISTFIEDFIEMGVDVLNPVQLSAAGMDANDLKERFGSRITFWGGGVDTQNLLPNGTPEQIKHQVTERLDILARGGGYVFNTIHNIMGNVPAQNIAACFAAAREFKF
ncbi:MAG: uroporphyrinogen decarboxylase family protein [Lachnospiraceae bacterium]